MNIKVDGEEHEALKKYVSHNLISYIHADVRRFSKANIGVWQTAFEIRVYSTIYHFKWKLEVYISDIAHVNIVWFDSSGGNGGCEVMWFIILFTWIWKILKIAFDKSQGILALIKKAIIHI